MSIYIWISIALIFFITIGGFGVYLAWRDVTSPKTQTRFELKWTDKLGLFLALIPGIGFLFYGIASVILIGATIFNIDNLRESFTISDIPLCILGIGCLFFGLYIMRCLIKVLLFKYKSVYVDNNNQKLVIEAKNSSLIETPFEGINSIVTANKGIIRGIYIDFVEIHTSNGENYELAITKATEFCELLPKNINIKKL